MRSHKCGDDWVAGSSQHCDSPNHQKLDRQRIAFREGVKGRRKADRSQGVIGQDRGGYVDGGEGGY